MSAERRPRDDVSVESRITRLTNLWVSLAVAAVALAQPLLTRRDPDRDADASPVRRILDPRVWPMARLVSFALLNIGIAAGIEIGFDPRMR